MGLRPLGVQLSSGLMFRDVLLNSVPLSHCNIYGGPNKPIHNASFSETSIACLLLKAELLENFEKWSTMCKIHLYSPSGVVDISIRSICMRSETLCTLIGFKGALVVRVCGFVCAQVLQCFRTNSTSWRLMPKNRWFNAAKVLFLPAWIEFVWCS